MNHIRYQPIGIIHTPFTQIEGVPIQPSAGKGVKGHIVIQEEFSDGLSDLEEFSHIYLLYHFHRSESYHLKVVPFLDDQPRGVFSTRAPKRPNSIGLSVVQLNNIESTTLEIENVDMIDGTPLLDIKPYVDEMNGVETSRIGWLSGAQQEMKSKTSDERFT